MLPPTSTLAEALDWASRELAGIDAPQAESRRLLAHLLGITAGAVYARESQTLTEVQAREFAALIARRRAGEPFAYITGERAFWTLSLRVTPDVLVPRPETELLVERALLHGAGATRLKVADLGTGSGCIALALASEQPQWELTAVDLSAAALAVAQGNAQRLGVQNVDFVHGSWCTPLAGQRFDLIVSNPPYIGAQEQALRDPALRHEPQTALTPGADALQALRTIVQQAPQHLAAGGWLLLEHGATQAEAVRALLVAQGFAHVTSQRDLAGIERVTEGTVALN